LEGRPGKQEDGSAKTRDVKLCTIWSAYSAAIESAAAPDSAAERWEFAERVLREATRRVLIGLNGAPLWAKLRHDELDVENIDVIIQALIEHSQTCEESRKGIDFFQTNRHRMKYVQFHAQGLCTSTGVVEAGCKVAIGERLKQSGMHWSVRGADAIYRLTMRQAQPTLRGLLGTRFFHFLVVHPRELGSCIPLHNTPLNS